MDIMYVDKQGRADKIKLGRLQGLVPIIEAITNSIHAIEDAGNLEDGKITVTIHREKMPLIADEESKNLKGLADIHEVTIQDNGVGFTEENFSSFNRSDSTYKKARGGKGVGRFSWLRAFESAQVDSVYEEKGKKYQITFPFTVGEDEIAEPVEVESVTPTGTIIKLKKMKKEVGENTAKQFDTIAKHILDHCLLYFVKGEIPIIELWENATDEKVTLQNLYKNSVISNQGSAFDIKEEKFEVQHIMFEGGTHMEHKIAYAAHDRIVEFTNIKSTDINGLNKTLDLESGRKGIYIGCVSGDYLDKIVSDDRTSFVPTGTLFADIPLKEIKSLAINSSKAFLSEHTEDNLQENRRRITQIIHKRYPSYRMLANHCAEEFDKIPMDAQGEKLEEYLHKLYVELGFNLKKEAARTLKNNRNINYMVEDAFKKTLGKYHEYNQGQLADYVFYRHNILQLLQKAVEEDDEGKMAYEEAVHNIIFPIRKTSDDIEYHQHNLWVIDERLSYHSYLASDKQLKTYTDLDSESSERPDIAIFNRKMAFTEQLKGRLDNIIIIEFKRPMRDDYAYGKSTGENPIAQVLNYADTIKEGKIKGRRIPVEDNTPTYCYIIADITPTLQHVIDREDLSTRQNPKKAF